MAIVGFDKMSLLDYEDKVSSVIFYKACNFRCPFCHNGLTVLEAEDEYLFDAIYDYLKNRKGLIDAVTFTGGEPTLDSHLKEHIIKIKELGYLIKLDSNGTNPEIIEDLLNNNLLDYIAMDIKNNEAKYPLTAGVNQVDMAKIKRSIKLIMNSGIPYEFRTTLVNEFHNIEDMKGIGELIKGGRIIYLQKFVDREGCIKKGLHEVDESLANKFKDILEQYIDEVELRGY